MKLLANFGDRDIWVNRGGVTWTKRTDILPAGITSNHILSAFTQDLGLFFPNLHVLACTNAGNTLGLYLSHDGLLTTPQVLRPIGAFPTGAWPSGAVGNQVAIGPSAGADARIIMTQTVPSSTTERDIAKRLHEPNWSHDVIASPNDLDGSDIMVPRCLTSTLWFVIGAASAGSTHATKCIRTKDAGATWAALALRM